MRLIKLNEKQKAEMKRITKYFLEATEPIEDSYLKAHVAVKILSRLAAMSDRLTHHLKTRRQK